MTRLTRILILTAILTLLPFKVSSSSDNTSSHNIPKYNLTDTIQSDYLRNYTDSIQ